MKETKVSFLSLVRKFRVVVNRQFRYADRADVMMLIVGTIGSIIVGISFPLNLLIVTEVVIGFVAPDANIQALKTMDEMIKWYVLLASITLAFGFAQMFCFSLSSKRQSRRIRLRLFKVSCFPVQNLTPFANFHSSTRAS